MDNTFRQGTYHQALLNGLTVLVKRWDLTEEQALEGKDVKDMLLNVGSGGGAAAAAPSGGGAAPAAGGDAPAEKEEEKKEEGEQYSLKETQLEEGLLTLGPDREGRIGRGHGFRSLRLSQDPTRFFPLDTLIPTWINTACIRVPAAYQVKELSHMMSHYGVHGFLNMINSITPIHATRFFSDNVVHQSGSSHLM